MILEVANLFMTGFIFFFCVRLYIKMSEWDELSLLLEEQFAPYNEEKEVVRKVIVTGGAKTYLGKELTCEQLDQLPPAEVSKYYNRYLIKVGANMSKNLGSALIKLYSNIANQVIGADKDKLASDLESDPIIGEALTQSAADLYFKLGKWLAPLVVGIITVNNCNLNIYGGGEQQSANPTSGDAGASADNGD